MAEMIKAIRQLLQPKQVVTEDATSVFIEFPSTQKQLADTILIEKCLRYF